MNKLIKTALFVVILVAGFIAAKLTQLEPPQVKQDLMVHDYVILYAQKLCEKHEGFHYIVPLATPVTQGSWAPMCEDVYKIRCQDEYLIELNTGASCCDCVGKLQWDETLKEDAKLKLHL